MSFKNKINLFFYLTVLLLPAIFAQIGGFSPSQEEIADVFEHGTIISKIFYPLALIWSLYVIKNKVKTLYWTKFEIVLTAYLVMGIIYSPSPGIVLRATFTAITTLLLWNTIAHVISDKYPLEIVVETFIHFVLLYGVIELVFWYLDTSRMDRYGEMGRYIGFFQHSNLFAKIITFGLIMNVWYLISKRRKEKYYWISGTILVLLLLGSGSRTSLIAFIVSIFISIVIMQKMTLRHAFSLAITSILGCLLFESFLFDFISKIDNGSYSNVMEAGTFVYRQNMWTVLLPSMLEHFWFGVGLNSFWSSDTLFYYGISVAGIHNGYLQVFQDLGVIGLVLVITIHLPLVKSLTIPTADDTAQLFHGFLIACWIFFLIVNITEGDLGNYRSSMWGMLIVLSLIYSLYLKRNDKVRQI